MKKERVLSILVAVALLAISCFTATPVSATVTDSDPTITVSSAQGVAGDTVSVTVTLSNNPGIASMRLKITYDPNYLTLTGAQDGGLLGNDIFSSNHTSPYTLMWFNPTVTTNYTANGVIATLTFEINELSTSAMSAPITASFVTANDCLDNDIDPVSMTVVSGAVAIAASCDDILVRNYNYNFRNYTDYDYPEMSTNGHRVISYGGAQDFDNGTTKYWWDKSSGITAYGALVGGATIINTGYGYDGRFGKLTIRGNQGVDANMYGGKVVKIEQGYTYTVTATYVPIAMTSYSNPIEVAIGLTMDNGTTYTRAIGTKKTHYSNAVARGGQFLTYQPNVVRYSQAAINQFGNGTLLTEAIASAVPAQTISATYTYTGANTADLGAYFSVMVGTGGSNVNLTDYSTYKLSQILVTDVTITVTPTNSNYTATFTEGTAVTKTYSSVDNQFQMPAADNTEGFLYWTTANGGTYYPGDTVTVTSSATAFIAVYAE
ncbi:MAG: hypothetical protein E7525_03775 [Ruminococcaceae bacterium]|nr:hypothetical protein [Oscillospiraceae bacterium]